MDSDAATLRRLVDQVEQIRQQHDTNPQNVRAKHEIDLAAIRTVKVVDLAALPAENKRIRAPPQQRHPDPPPGSQFNPGGATRADVCQAARPAPLRGVINTIAGGFAGGGASSSARKKHRRNVNRVHLTTSVSTQGSPAITFTDDDYAGVNPNHDDPMVVTMALSNWEVHKTLVDQGSLADILYWPTFLRLDVPHSLTQPHKEPLVGFAGKSIHTRGYLDLLTTFGAPPDSRWVMV
uniref:Uncharacterized protein n=1 Tax=Cajanus cajan TaxID=3821 RepID=A0A151SM95_CAJCA|nr:hypothetical protein KK1_002177 [Cajanus cajan]